MQELCNTSLTFYSCDHTHIVPCTSVYLHHSDDVQSSMGYCVCKRNQYRYRLRVPLAMHRMSFISSVCARSLTTSNYYSKVYLSFSNGVPMPTKPNPQIRHPAINCSIFFSFFQSLPGNHAITATHFLKGGLCVMIEGKALRVQINFSLHPFIQRPKCILRALTKVWHVWFFFFTSASSASHSFLLVLISVSWGEGKKGEDSCIGSSGTEASWENSVKLEKDFRI